MAKKLPDLGPYTDEDMRELLTHLLEFMTMDSVREVLHEVYPGEFGDEEE